MGKITLSKVRKSFGETHVIPGIDLNIEQQAMVVEHKFRLSRGAIAPADPSFYDRVCPIGRRMEI